MNNESHEHIVISDLLDQVEKRVLRQVAKDLELMGPLNESDIIAHVKKMPTGIRGPFVFAIAGMPALRKKWSDQDRMALGEGFSQMILRSIACYLGSEDYSEFVGIGRVYGESEALLTYVLGIE